MLLCADAQDQTANPEDRFSSVEVYNRVNVLKSQTLFSFCSQIKCGFSGLELTTNREDPDQTAEAV